MASMRGLMIVSALLALAACEDMKERRQAGGSTTPAYERVSDSALTQPTVAVRIGESGPNFPACTSRGTSRRVVAGEPLIVRVAPFESAGEARRLPADATFFVCSRTLDQKWSGIVFDAAGAASPACAVTAPVARRGDYAGPCRSGWVPSVLIRQGAV